jgi:hypothetical protein
VISTTFYHRALAVVAVICVAGQALAADHRDGPRVVNADRATVALDLNDLYAFVSPQNKNNSVLILTTGGLDVGILSEPFFLPGAIFEIRVSNDGVATNDELVFTMVFSNPDRFGRQNYTVRLTRRKPNSWDKPVVARGVTGQRVNGSLGIKVQAGVFDDPFFFDSGAFGRFRTNTMNDPSAPVAQRAAPFLPPNTPINGFRRNTLAVIMELPRVQLHSNPNNPNITIWLRALLPDGTPFDRTGLPAINTATLFDIPPLGLPSLQNAFNDLTPADDVGLRGIAAQRINVIYGLPLTGAAPNGGPNATQLAAIVLPDVMPFNTTSTSGFLNGRRLQDDVIDAELNLLTGGLLPTDRVGNDSVFLNQFPYLGDPSAPPPATAKQ